MDLVSRPGPVWRSFARGSVGLADHDCLTVRSRAHTGQQGRDQKDEHGRGSPGSNPPECSLPWGPRWPPRFPCPRLSHPCSRGHSTPSDCRGPWEEPIDCQPLLCCLNGKTLNCEELHKYSGSSFISVITVVGTLGPQNAVVRSQLLLLVVTLRQHWGRALKMVVCCHCDTKNSHPYLSAGLELQYGSWGHQDLTDLVYPVNCATLTATSSSPGP